MTNLVYYSTLYKGYLKGTGIIKELDFSILNDLIKSCKPSDLFIYSTWCEIDDTIKELVEQKPKRAIIYSGMDWHDTGYRKPFHDYVKSKVEEVIYVGNTDGPGYFSYWLFFIDKYYKHYSVEELTPTSLDFSYMCLNRKRHGHRLRLVKELKSKDLLKYGLVSLGGDPQNNIPPMIVDEIISPQGDNSVADFGEGISNDIDTLGSLANWNRYLINVVTETTHFSDTFISEKTWKPIIGLRPFIILGDLKIYSYLKDYGIDTFDDLFGTGYLEKDFLRRIQWVVETIDKFKDVNLNNLFIYLLPRLIKNKERMNEIFKINENRFYNVKNLLSYS